MSHKDEFKSGPKKSVGAGQRVENQDQIPKALLNISKQLFGKSLGEEMTKVMQAGGVFDMLQPSTKAEPSANRELHVRKKKDELSVANQTVEGVHTVFCIDTSGSMECHNAFANARTFVDDYISTLRDDFKRNSKRHFTSLVTIGEETILHHGWNKDVSTLLETIDNLVLSGDGDLALGLEYSKTVAIKNDYATTENTTLLREIIVITDGRATEFDAKCKSYGNKREYFSREKEEVADIRKEHVGIQFVYVGDPDKKLQDQLCEINGRELEQHTSGQKLANLISLKVQMFDMIGLQGENKNFLKQMNDLLISQFEDIISAYNASIDDPTDDKDVQKVRTMMLPIVSLFKDLIKSLFQDIPSRDDWKSHLLKLVEKQELAITTMKKMINSSCYDEIQEMQKRAPIGCRVRRGPDWMWADQDNGGPGTVVGHLYDELRKYWCWVEWDIGGEINVYRWDMNGKCDLTIIDEDRQPEEGIIMVGCKVAPGEGYEGTLSHVIGIAIKYLDDNKMQVRWDDDGSRENLTYGKDGTPKQLVPANDTEMRKKGHEKFGTEVKHPTVYGDSTLENKSLLAPPEFLEVCDILEHTANVRWQKCRDDKSSSNSKYVVTYVQKNKPHVKTVVEVVAAVSCILDDLKPASEYSVDVKFVYDDGESLPTDSYSFKTRETDTDDLCYEDWKLTEIDASRLSEAVGSNWQKLGPYLGLSNIKIAHIREDNHSATLRIYNMFLKWVGNDKDNSFRNLCKIFEKNPSVQVDKKILNEMKKEHPL